MNILFLNVLFINIKTQNSISFGNWCLCVFNFVAFFIHKCTFHKYNSKLFLYLLAVNATHLYTHKGQAQTVSSGAALSMQAMCDDFATMFEGSEAFRKSADEMNEIKSWEPAHLYIFTRGNARVSLLVNDFI